MRIVDDTFLRELIIGALVERGWKRNSTSTENRRIGKSLHSEFLELKQRARGTGTEADLLYWTMACQALMYCTIWETGEIASSNWITILHVTGSLYEDRRVDILNVDLLLEEL